MARSLGISAVLLLAGAVGCGQAPDRPGMASMTASDPEPTMGFEVTPEPETEPQGCVGVDAAAETLPVDLLALVDRSGSMKDPTFTGVSKWSATTAAFRDFLESAPDGMGLGLSLFPLPGDGGGSCKEQRYLDATLPIQPASEMVSDVLKMLDSTSPRGGTPTAPALEAALESASDYAESHKDRSVVVVLVTDGLPTVCDPVDTAAIAQLARDGLRGRGHVRTLLVALHSLSGDEESGFAAIAAAGGTGQPLSIDPRVDFSSQLSRALGSAATRRVACDLALPEPPEHQRLDYDAVNVVLEGKTRTTFPRVDDSASCTAAGGWFYDVDPEKGAPSRLNMCKASCERLNDSGGASLHVELGCETVVVH